MRASLKRAPVDEPGTSLATDEEVLWHAPVFGPLPTDSPSRPEMALEAANLGVASPASALPPSLPAFVVEPVVVTSGEGSQGAGDPSRPLVSGSPPSVTRGQ